MHTIPRPSHVVCTVYLRLTVHSTGAVRWIIINLTQYFEEKEIIFEQGKRREREREGEGESVCRYTSHFYFHRGKEKSLRSGVVQDQTLGFFLPPPLTWVVLSPLACRVYPCIHKTHHRFFLPPWAVQYNSTVPTRPSNTWLTKSTAICI